MFFKDHFRPFGIGALAILLAVLVGLPGCSHQVRTFFFTGVPEPGQEQVDANEPPKTLSEQRAARIARAGASRQQAELRAQTRQYVHGPFGAGRCDSCHVTSGGKQVRAADGALTTTKLRVSQRFVYSDEELCVSCHSEKSATAARQDELWQHGPAANGLCTACHSPHAADRPFMLLKQDDQQLCDQCHERAELRHTPQHSADSDAVCTVCHNPHAGRNPMLLRANYDERQFYGGT